jgi:hypothetical protein
LATDEDGRIWHITLTPIEINANGAVLNVEMHVGTDFYDVEPIDAMYLWNTIDYWSWRNT